jgi:hypothetical protein
MYRVGRLGAVRLVDNLSPVGQQITGLHHRVTGLVPSPHKEEEGEKRRVRHADGGRKVHHTLHTTHTVLRGHAGGFWNWSEPPMASVRVSRK